jgi:predicted metal-dependent phosphoesterase TrpH
MPTYRIDLHMHCHGDPIDTYISHTPRELVDHALAAGLNAIAVTWHTKAFDDDDAIRYAASKGLLLIPGMETNLFGQCHTLAINVRPGWLPAESSIEDLQKLRSEHPETFVVAPHPYYPHWTCLNQTIDAYPELFDGVEWCNLHVAWLPSWINPNERARQWAERHRKPVMAFSDAHELDDLGEHFTEVDAEALTCEAIFAALRARKVRFTPRPLSLRFLARRLGEVVRDHFPRAPVQR